MKLLILSIFYSVITTFQITSLLSTVLSNFFTKSSKANQKLKKAVHQRSQIVAEKNSVSPQNEYAKWTKLNRKLDVIDIEIKDLRAELGNQSSNWTTQLNKLNWLIQIPIFYSRFRNYEVVSNANLFVWLPSSLQYFLKNKSGSGISINLWLFFLNILLFELRAIYTTLTNKEILVKPVEPVKQTTEELSKLE